MASLFSSPPKPKAAPAPEPVPSMSDRGVQAADAAERARMKRSGRSSTILTSPTGVASAAPMATKTLLGS